MRRAAAWEASAGHQVVRVPSFVVAIWGGRAHTWVAGVDAGLTLVRHAVKCLVSDGSHRLCEDLLRRDVGAPALPQLEEVARTDLSASIRTRAARLLARGSFRGG